MVDAGVRSVISLMMLWFWGWRSEGIVNRVSGRRSGGLRKEGKGGGAGCLEEARVKEMAAVGLGSFLGSTSSAGQSPSSSWRSSGSVG